MVAQNKSANVLRSRFDIAVNLLTCIACLSLALAAWRVYRSTENRPYGAELHQLIEPVRDVTVTLPERTRQLGDGRVALIEFSDFECRFCGRFATTTFPTLKTNYIDKGKLRYAVKHLPLTNIHPHSLSAAMAAECAATHGRYWQAHETLFRNQNALADEQLRNYVVAAGVDDKGRVTCTTDNQIAAAVSADRSEAVKLRILGTPTFMLGMVQPDGRTVAVSTRFNGAVPYDQIVKVLDGLVQH
jgi:protein-disulfide isomerase